MAVRSASRRPTEGLKYARSIVHRVCAMAGHVTCIDDLRHAAIDAGLIVAVENSDTPAIFDWLMDILSYQGISDAVANGFMKEHGNVTWAQITRALSTSYECQKLQGYWVFSGCLYQKTSQTCAEHAYFH